MGIPTDRLLILKMFLVALTLLTMALATGGVFGSKTFDDFQDMNSFATAVSQSSYRYNSDLERAPHPGIKMMFAATTMFICAFLVAVLSVAIQFSKGLEYETRPVKIFDSSLLIIGGLLAFIGASLLLFIAAHVCLTEQIETEYKSTFDELEPYWNQQQTKNKKDDSHKDNRPTDTDEVNFQEQALLSRNSPLARSGILGKRGDEEIKKFLANPPSKEDLIKRIQDACRKNNNFGVLIAAGVLEIISVLIFIIAVVLAALVTSHPLPPPPPPPPPSSITSPRSGGQGENSRTGPHPNQSTIGARGTIELSSTPTADHILSESSYGDVSFHPMTIQRLD